MNPQSRQRWGEVAGSLAVLAALLALWWAASHQQWVSKVFLPTPESALASLLEGLRDGELAAFTSATGSAGTIAARVPASASTRTTSPSRSRASDRLIAEGLSRRRLAALSTSRVTFAALTAAQIRRYVDSGEPMGKAGAYGVQGRAAAHIARIHGSYSGIMGLPLFETCELLQSFKNS